MSDYLLKDYANKWQCKIANSLGGGFAGTPYEVWNTTRYRNNIYPTVFFGLYGLPDFFALWKHPGRRCILWCGSDIIHFVNGYWLENKGQIKLNPKPLAKWINKYCESWVENKVEYETLKRVGIEAKICPSFLGDVRKFKPQKNLLKNTYYSSVSGNDFKLYGWDKINKIAKDNPQNKYYLYGNTVEWKTPKNVIVMGRVTQKEMDKEIKKMTGAIRMTGFEGFSEIICKSILWGQKPISLIPYNYTRRKLLRILNKFPWNQKHANNV